jgi:hypothetical protein
MEFLLRYFIDGNEDCGGHVWSYTHAALMIIPRIGERVWLDDGICVEVDMVTYVPDYHDGDKLYMIDIECHDITEDVLYECDEEDY